MGREVREIATVPHSQDLESKLPDPMTLFSRIQRQCTYNSKIGFRKRFRREVWSHCIDTVVLCCGIVLSALLAAGFFLLLLWDYSGGILWRALRGEEL